MTNSPKTEPKKLPVSVSRENLMSINNSNYTMSHGNSSPDQRPLQETKSEERTCSSQNQQHDKNNFVERPVLAAASTEQPSGTTIANEPKLGSRNGNITPPFSPQIQQCPVTYFNATLNQGVYQQPALTGETPTYTLLPTQLPPVVTPPATEKPKRHQVKNACVNCQKACKKCDDGRPCKRCIKCEMTDTCKSSTRKERKKGIKRGPYKKKEKITANPNATASSSTNIPSTGVISTNGQDSYGTMPIPLLGMPGPYFMFPTVSSTAAPYVFLTGACIPPMVIKQEQNQQKSNNNNTEKKEETLSSKEKSPDHQSRSSSISSSSSQQYQQQLKSDTIDKNVGSKLTLLSQVCSDMLKKTDPSLFHSSQTIRKDLHIKPISMPSFTSTTQTDDNERATDRLQAAVTSHHADLRQEPLKDEIVRESSEDNSIRESNKNIRQETGSHPQYTYQTQFMQFQSANNNNNNNFSQYYSYQDHQRQQKHQPILQQESQNQQSSNYSYIIRPTLPILQPSNIQQEIPAQLSQYHNSFLSMIPPQNKQSLP
ncbi:7191_t:CDS:2 [Ambispora gerdemannii]|uniref:7191_t:CDS:1 n=1 Tax=Ambispora gerdemannii TaxID=144530 RepID=A0A9N8ZWV4_9GLOM|nr:7191_t:CDS:2 [Ambispora gerdemannii]